MNRHQVLTGAANFGDRCFAVGSINGVHFTAYASGCNIVILAANFERVQIIPGAVYGSDVQVTCVTCCQDTGKIAASYGSRVCVFEPTLLLNRTSSHKLDFHWCHTGTFQASSDVTALEWNAQGTRLLTACSTLQMWEVAITASTGEEPMKSDIEFYIEDGDGPPAPPQPCPLSPGSSGEDKGPAELVEWVCIWTCKTATSVTLAKFSSDGSMFATTGQDDRMVRVWYENKRVMPLLRMDSISPRKEEVNYSFVYVSHPRAVTGLSWRSTSKHLRRGDVANMLLTSCKDQICRIWAETMLPDDGLMEPQNYDSSQTGSSSLQAHRHNKRFGVSRSQQNRNSLQHRQEPKLSSSTTSIHSQVSRESGGQTSLHDYHKYGSHLGSVTPTLHMHLAASINANTDIPLMASLAPNGCGVNGNDGNFVVHWLNNKAIHATLEGESILLELARQASGTCPSDPPICSGGAESDEEGGANSVSGTVASPTGSGRRIGHATNGMTAVTSDPILDDVYKGIQARKKAASMKMAKSYMSLDSEKSGATGGGSENVVEAEDPIDKKELRLEQLLRDWRNGVDMLFSIHPADGSFLVWLVDYLDEPNTGTFRQASVSFSSLIPNAFPLYDALSMVPQLFLYCDYGPLGEIFGTAEQLAGRRAGLAASSGMAGLRSMRIRMSAQAEKDGNENPCVPSVMLLSKHSNGTLNLWQVAFADLSHFASVVSVSHAARASGHRFHANGAVCHPVLPLLLTTSHHSGSGGTDLNATLGNSAENDEQNSPKKTAKDSAECEGKEYSGRHAAMMGGYCSELILWRVAPVGPLSKSGGITELARVSSPMCSSFSNVAWLPTLLPCSSLGPTGNSPSALFVASDGKNLRLYQAVLDARSVLKENQSYRQNTGLQDSGVSNDPPVSAGSDRFNVVSLQSTSRPGCIIDLAAIVDSQQDWENIELMHVFQDQLVTGSRSTNPDIKRHSSAEAIVNLQNVAMFEEHFYLVILERKTSVLHMWKIVIASQDSTPGVDYSPDVVLSQEEEELLAAERRSNIPLHPFHSQSESSNIQQQQQQQFGCSEPALYIRTTKVCTQTLSLPGDATITSATVAAGHLSSSSIYPACFAPYLLSTACSDRCVRFWRCNLTNGDSANGSGAEFKPEGGVRKDVIDSCHYEWEEWEMMIRNEDTSMIRIPGQILSVSCAYSGRVAVAYRPGSGRHASNNPRDQFSNLRVSIFECESTGGSEWTLEDTIELKNIEIASQKIELDLSRIFQTDLATTLPVLEKDSSGPNPSSSTSNFVPSFSTVKGVRHYLSTTAQKTIQPHMRHLVHLDWVSTEDGSHVLTVGVGPTVLLYAAVSNEMAVTIQSRDAATGKNKSTASETTAAAQPARGLLQKTKSMALNTAAVQDIRWLSLRAIDLQTADGLAPLPMHVSWVRNGILVVGMDNEIHVYSQWRSPNDDVSVPMLTAAPTERVAHVTGSSSFLAPSKSVSRSTSGIRLDASILNLCLLAEKDKDRKATGGGASNRDDATKAANEGAPLTCTSGLFEAARVAHPILPQYHPKQLIELLNCGRIRRVKAILSHLVRCISGETRDGYQGGGSRGANVSFGSGGGPRSPVEPLVGSSEESDYIEIASIPPLPLYALLAADQVNIAVDGTGGRNQTTGEADYNNLFTVASVDDSALDDMFGDSDLASANKSTMPSNPYQFNQSQADRLASHLTRTELPGMSSLDQMYLLALAQTVANTKVDFMDTVTKNGTVQEAPEPTMAESVDDCGLRFLLAARHRIYLLSTLPIRQRVQLQQRGLGPDSYVWAFHSEAEEELLASLPSMQKGEPTWAELKQFGVGWWIRNINTLTRCIEKVAKAAFQISKDPLDSALFYVAMRKNNVLWGLFRSQDDKKMAQFFKNNFEEERWRKAAMKNAFALLGKQKFMRAAAFFLLGGSVKDAIEVCLNRMDDLQLALVILRLYDTDLDPARPSMIKSLLYEKCLGCDAEGQNYDPARANPDPFIRSMAYWMLKDHHSALGTLLEVDIGEEHSDSSPHAPTDSKPTAPASGLDEYSSKPSVFNFYNFLRTHPLLMRQHLATTAANKSQTVLISGFSHTGTRKTSNDGVNVTYVDRITPVERRLYFMTAREHFKNGCPLLALEVLSKLPEVVDVDSDITKSRSGDGIGAAGMRRAGTQDGAVDQSVPASVPLADQTVSALDWSQPATRFEEEKLDLAFSDSDNDEDEDDDVKKSPVNKERAEPSQIESVPELDSPDDISHHGSLTATTGGVGDIMAHQLKFIACIKIIVDELSTLATGFEVDGGQLRYQLYVWLEKEVEVLKRVCGYICDSGMPATEKSSEGDVTVSDTRCYAATDGATSGSSSLTLHEVILAERQDFEAKLNRMERRRHWLKANQLLLRTLMSYSVLHGSRGGGLASVRMELLLLLQELQQQKSHKQLLSPLPFPTTLPLLSASVASSNTVIADPIQYVQGMCQDVLKTLGERITPPSADSGLVKAMLLRDISTALSSCLYQCLCDSDSFVVSVSERVDVGMEGFTSTHVVYKDSHLMTGARSKRTPSTGGSCSDPINILELPTSLPAKWPGVSTLITLIDRRQIDSETPKLHILLCESLVAVHTSLLYHALTMYDANVLYRMVGHPLEESIWPLLYGGGIKKHVIVATSDARQNGDEMQKQRMKLQTKLMGPAAVNQRFQEDRPTYQEKFIPPQTSMIRHFMTKMNKEEHPGNEYDSADSLSSDDDDEEDDEYIGSMARNDTAVNEHLDPHSYSWTLMRYAIVKYMRNNMEDFLPKIGTDLSDLPTCSPLVHNVLKNLEKWEERLREELESFPGPPLDFIPGCYVDPTPVGNGITIHKYETLMNPSNTPFRSNHYSARPAKRLWNFLVTRDYLQDVFIRFVFRKQRIADDIALLKCGEPKFEVEPMKIVHKDQEMLSCFCLNQSNQNSIVIATQKEIIELDIAKVLSPPDWIVDEMGVERDIEIIRNPINQPDKPEEFLMVRAPYDSRIMGSGGVSSPSGSGGLSTSQLQPGATLLTKRSVPGVRRMDAHPILPYYLTGSQDGCVRLWEWNRPECVSELRKSGAFPKVTKVLFNEHGNKFGVSDTEGAIALWQLSLGASSNRPYLSLKCHNKVTSDFAFIGASSMIASAGHSTDNRNVCLWDTLISQRKGPVQSFHCHVDGCPALLYAPQHQALVCGGKKGEICIFDVRQRQLRHTFQAHDSSIKCMALDSVEDCFVTGSADGDIKVWGLTVHQLLHNFSGEHSKGSSLFRHSGAGVTQLMLTSKGHLLSSGEDGSLKVRQLLSRRSALYYM